MFSLILWKKMNRFSRIVLAKLWTSFHEQLGNFTWYILKTPQKNQMDYRTQTLKVTEKENQGGRGKRQR